MSSLYPCLHPSLTHLRNIKYIFIEKWVCSFIEFRIMIMVVSMQHQYCWSTPLPSLPGPLCPGVVAPDRVLSKGQ